MAADEIGSVRGDVVHVDVRHDSAQPYRITLTGHRFAYDVALLVGSDPPALSDLRLVALDSGTPIETSDLMAAPVAKLALIAAKHARRGDIEADRTATERMRAGLAATFGIDGDDVTLHSYEAPGPVLVPAPPKRGRGRPPKPKGFYTRVAAAAYEAANDPERRSIARGVQARAAQWPEVDATPSLSTVERWLKEARKRRLYQGPRTVR